MPRILRNYLISFAVIGMILIIVNWIDHYLTSNEIPPVSESQSRKSTQYRNTFPGTGFLISSFPNQNPVESL